MGNNVNPYAIGFGIKPYEYIERMDIIDEITESFTAEFIQHPCYMLSGMRGMGKTVTMVSLGEQLQKDDNWVVLRLNPESVLLNELAAKLYDCRKFISDFINAEINLSGFGIGLSLNSVSPAASMESALEKILKHMKNKNMKLLVEIDEVSDTPQIRMFAHAFQTFIGANLPIFLIMTGLSKNIKELQEGADCTFLYRAEEVILEPLNPTKIRDSYIRTLAVDSELAWEMAVLSKGYPIAYQAIGKYMWEQSDKEVTEELLEHVDMALSRYVYKKIWSELSVKEKWFLSFMSQKDTMQVSELLELSNQKKNEFSQYRARLIERGILISKERGVIKFALPRFNEFIKVQVENEVY